jgi:hypothetical protein
MGVHDLLKRIGMATADLLLCAIGILSVVVSVRSLLAPPKTVAGADTLLSLMLAALGLLLIAAVIERRVRLDKLSQQIQDLMVHLEPGSTYLADSRSISDALHKIVETCSETILCIGALSSDRDYLRAVEDAVKRREVPYYRVINSDHIYHPMHEHLLALMENPNTNIRWVEREKYGNITVTDKGAVLAFPSPYPDKLTGLLISLPSMVSPYIQLVLAVYAVCEPVTESKLRELCEKCRSATGPGRDMAHQED